MMRILHVIPGLTGGGAERQLALLARTQVARGHEVHIGVIRGELPGSLAAAPAVKVHTLPLRGHHDPLLLLRIRELMQQVRADIVQTWLTLMDVMGGGAALMSGRPWILSERSEAAQYPWTWKNATRARLARFASAIVANSAGGVKYWASQGVPANRLVEVPNAVDSDAIANAPEALLPPACAGRPLVLFVGRLSEEKRPFVLIEALARALPTVGATAMLCGDGPLAGEMAALIRARGAGEHILMAGHRADVYGLFRKASLCIAISRFEGSPNVVLEAIASGCPLIVSDIRAYRELLDETSAEFVPLDDVDASARAITSVLQNPAAAAARALRARTRIAALTPVRVAAALDDVYERVLRAPSG